MSDFRETTNRIAAKIKARSQAVFVNVASRAHAGIVNGDPLTGALGQPVDTGNLRDSWQLQFESPTAALISTNVEYAPIIEDNVRGVTFKNHGPHSVRLTIAGLGKIVEAETLKAVGNG
jgi:hypothetical protein